MIGGARLPNGHSVSAKRVGVVLLIECKAEALPSRRSMVGSASKMVAGQRNGSDFASTMISKFGGTWSYVGQVGTPIGLIILYGVEARYALAMFWIFQEPRPTKFL
jgi:hypothetical protein